jgi:hypothetical protein
MVQTWTMTQEQKCEIVHVKLLRIINATFMFNLSATFLDFFIVRVLFFYMMILYAFFHITNVKLGLLYVHLMWWTF